MSPEHEESRGGSGALLDRLVDGELSEFERRECLAQLEADPGGWRRCALAFLEAQTWKHALGDLADRTLEPRQVPRAASAAPATSRRAPSRAWLRSTCALAATALLAFALGWRLAPPATPGAARPVETGGLLVDQKSAPSDPERMRTYYDEYDLARWIAWNERGESAVEPETTNAEAAPRVPRISATPDYSQGALLRQGYSFERQQGFVPVGLEDGRQVAVPVEQVQVRFTGLHAY